MSDATERLAKATARASGGRRAQRDRSRDVEAAILDAAEALLENAQLHELSVADIIREAGVSRTTFYFYFGSKFSVVAALLSRAAEELLEAVRPWVTEASASEAQARERLLSSLQAAGRVWRRRQAVTRSVVEHWNVDPEIGELWLAVVERFVEMYVAVVERDRRAGIAPPGPDASSLVSALTWSTERVLYIAVTGTDPRLPDLDTALEVLADMWASAIYGTPSPPARRRAKAGAAAKQPARGRR